MEYFFGLILSATFGAIFGSYATLFAYRLPIGESCFGRYFGNKSRCPNCNAIIKTRDLIPLLNWIITLGRCRSCQVKIPRTHLFIELLTTILFVICYMQFSFSEQFIIYAVICVSCVILFVTDYTHKIFPNSVLNVILTVGLVNRVLQDQTIISAIYSAVIGVFFAVIFYQIFYKKSKALFASQEQSFDYTKFILVASLCLSQSVFLFYFFTVMVILTMLLLFKVPTKKKRVNFGYTLIIPFLWVMLYSPINL